MVAFLLGLAVFALVYLAGESAIRFVLARTQKVGGIHFFRFRRIRISFCLARAK